MNIYLIYGTEYSLIRKEINKICSDSEEIITYDMKESNIRLALDDANYVSLFDSKKSIICENFDLVIGSKEKNIHDIDYLINYINDENHTHNLILVSYLEKLDARSKIFNLLKDKAKVIYKQSFNPRKAKEYEDLVENEFKQNKYKIDSKTIKYFVEYVGKNVDILISEIEKLMLYKEEDKTITIKDINDISSKYKTDNVYDLSNYIMKKDIKKCFEVYEELKFNKIDATEIIAKLGLEFTFLYQCKMLSSMGYSNIDIKNELNAHEYRIICALNYDFMLYEIKDIIKKLHELDLNVKTGNKDANELLELFLLTL